MATGSEDGCVGVEAGPGAKAPARRTAKTKTNSKGNRRGLVGGVPGSVRYSKGVMRRICERIESGESLRTICADEEMPNRSSVRAWAARLPKVADDLERARAAAGWHGLCGRQPLWCEQTAADICTRLAAGETLTQICRDLTMPSLTTVYYWRVRRSEFADAVTLARQVQAEQFCDLGWEIASAVTPQDAYATHVKLTHLRWTAAALSPWRFGRFKPVIQEDDAEAELATAKAEVAAATKAGPVFTVRHFKNERQADGTVKVIAYLRDSRTGELRREHPEIESDPVAVWDGPM